MKSIKEISNTNKKSIFNNRKRYLSMKEKYLNEIGVKFDTVNIFVDSIEHKEPYTVYRFFLFRGCTMTIFNNNYISIKYGFRPINIFEINNDNLRLRFRSKF